MDEIRNYSMNQFNEFTIKELAGITDIQLLILKGHIIVEYTLNCYLESISKSEDPDFFTETFSFANKVKIAKHFGQLGDDENLIKELTLLNKLRNDIAHSLNYNKKHLDELFGEVRKKTKNTSFTNSPLTEIERTRYAVAFISGATFGAYKFHTDKKDLDNFLGE